MNKKKHGNDWKIIDFKSGLSIANPKTIANKPEKDINEALNPKVEIKLIEKLKIVIAIINKTKIGLVTSIINVISDVNTMVIKIPLILRRKLPGISLGALRKVPNAIAGANFNKSRALKITKGKTMATVSTTPL